MVLFNDNGGQTREREPIPHTVSPPGPYEPWSSTVTTTVARQTANMVRAITLAGLASANLSFLRERELVRPEELKVAERAVASLQKLLLRNSETFQKHLKRNAQLLDQGLRTNRQELDFALAALRKTDDPAQRTALGGSINILDLNRRRLERLAQDNNQVLEFFRRKQGRKIA